MSFLHRELPGLGKRVFRLGLAGNYGIDADGIRAAVDRGINYLYYTFRGTMAAPLKDVLGKRRDEVVVATQPMFAYTGGSVRRSAERTLKRLGTDYLDIFLLPWLGVGSAWTEGTLGEMKRLKESGKVRAFGISIHDRPRAGQLSNDEALDLLMIRYNAAHPGAERDIFPAFDQRTQRGQRRPAVIAYTATSWRKLLKRPGGWDGKIATAGDCYRFCLSSPHVDVVLCGPGSSAELDQNLAAIEQGPLSSDEDRWMRDFGRAVHG